MSSKRNVALLLGLASALAGSGCTGEGEGSGPSAPVTTAPPSGVALVASSGFVGPSDAVVSPNGDTFVFTAFTADEARLPAIFSVPSAGGDVRTLHAGAPLAFTTGLVMACDGKSAYVADLGASEDLEGQYASSFAEGAIYKMDLSSGTLAKLTTGGMMRPSGLAMAPDCGSLYATGWTASGEPALFELGLDGGEARVRYSGAPLHSPTGMYVDQDRVAWVVDHSGSNGSGTLYAINADNVLSEVVSGLRLGTPAGCSLVSGGGTAVIPTFSPEGKAQLTTIEIATGEIVNVETPEVQGPAGLRTAREAGVFAIVDNAGNAIYRGE